MFVIKVAYNNSQKGAGEIVPGKVFALHVANLRLIPNIPYGTLSTAGETFVHICVSF